jgi:hypothetical protein
VDHGQAVEVRYGDDGWTQYPDGYYSNGKTFAGWFDRAARIGAGKALHNAGERSCENQRVIKEECRVLSTFSKRTFDNGVTVLVYDAAGNNITIPDRVAYKWTISGQPGFTVEFEYTHSGDSVVGGQYLITDLKTGKGYNLRAQRDGSRPSCVKWAKDGKEYPTSIRWNYEDPGNNSQHYIVPGPWEAQ